MAVKFATNLKKSMSAMIAPKGHGPAESAWGFFFIC